MNEIDVSAVLRVCWRNFKWLALGLLCGGILLFSYTYFFVTPTYSSTALLMISSQDLAQSEGNVSSSAVTASQELTNSYVVMLKTDYMLQAVADDVGGSLTAKKVGSMISLSVPTDTMLIKITCTSTDPLLAQEVCQSMLTLAPVRLKELVQVGFCDPASEATVAERAGPNITRNTFFGALLGFLLVAAIIIIRWMTDVTIKGKEDLAHHTDVTVLAEIPAFESASAEKKSSRKTGKNKVTTSRSSGESKEGVIGREEA